MSDSNSLETAAVELKCKRCGATEVKESYSESRDYCHRHPEEIVKGGELVRRSDAEEIIESLRADRTALEENLEEAERRINQLEAELKQGGKR